MSKPAINVVLDHDDFEHLIRGGELQVATRAGTACIIASDIGWDVMQAIIKQAAFDRDTRLDEIKERTSRS